MLISTLRASVEGNIGSLEGSLATGTAGVAERARAVSALLNEAHAAIDQGDLDLLRQRLADRPGRIFEELATLPRRLRAAREHAALTVSNALAGDRRARRLFAEVDTSLGERLVAVVANAGCGKTELAAQLTAVVGDRPAGIFLQGQYLRAGHSLDDLARHVSIQGKPVDSMEPLVAAVDAAGQRARQRLPIVIDGLNEAQDPRDWQSLLASLDETLRQYPYVLVVCTVRTAFADEALPADISRLEIPGFDHDTLDAVRRYFEYYRIDPSDAELPWDLLSHP